MEEKENKEGREEKLSKILTGISMLDTNEFINLTPFSEKINCHKNTVNQELNRFDSMKSIGFELIKDKLGNIKGIIKTDEKMDIRKEIREIKKELIEIKKLLKHD